MLLTILGIILLLCPLLLLSKFENKKLGIMYIISFSILFHLLTAIITQLLHIFTYPIILSINIIALAMISIIFYKSDIKTLKEKIKQIKIDWVLLTVIAVSIICLSFVHFNYSGQYVTINSNYQQASHMQYQSPYFSDEWYSISLVDYSLQSGKLPMGSSLMKNPFLNLEFAFHSFLSNIFMILKLNPLFYYTLLTIFFSSLICILIYLFLRENDIDKLPSGITAISALYITNGANLSGMWNLIPLNLGIISFILGMFFISKKKTNMSILTGFLTLMFYPPLVIFFLLAILVQMIYSPEKTREQKIKQLSMYTILALAVAAIISIAYILVKGTYSGFFLHLLSRLIFPQYTGEFIPQYKIYYIVPIWTLLLSIIALFSRFKDKKWILSLVCLGLIYWAVYPFTIIRVLIDYSRVVFFTSILLTILSGFGLNYLINYLETKQISEKLMKFLMIIILILFLALSMNYTKSDKWENLKAVDSNGKRIMPAAPANQYLTKEDIQIFSNITNKSFLSLPWKGLTIGVYTKNRPLSTKPGTMGISPNLYSEFMQADCTEKAKIISSKKIDYLYVPKLNCTGYSPIANSSEGLFLYKTS